MVGKIRRQFKDFDLSGNINLEGWGRSLGWRKPPGRGAMPDTIGLSHPTKAFRDLLSDEHRHLALSRRGIRWEYR